MPKANSFQRVSVAVLTEDNTQTTAATFDTSPWDNAAFLVTARVTARDVDDATSVAGFIASGLFYVADGTLALSGSVVDQFSEGEAWSVTMDANGDNIRVRVTGGALDIKWLVALEVQVNDESPFTATN